MISAEARAVIAPSIGPQCGGTAAETSHKRVVQGSRNHAPRRRAAHRSIVAVHVRQARLHHGLAQFLEEQRNAVGARDDLGTYLWRHRPAAHVVPQKLLRLLTVEPGEWQVQ